MTDNNKTKDYILRAQKNYVDKFERKTALFPKGTTERIRAVSDDSLNGFIVSATLEKIERLEAEKGIKEEYPF